MPGGTSHGRADSLDASELCWNGFGSLTPWACTVPPSADGPDQWSLRAPKKNVA